MSGDVASGETRRHEKYDRLIAKAREIPAVATAVAHPCDETSLKGAVEAAAAGMIRPIFVGPERKIREIAEKLKVDLRASKSSMFRTATPQRPRRSSWSAAARPSS